MCELDPNRDRRRWLRRAAGAALSAAPIGRLLAASADPSSGRLPQKLVRIIVGYPPGQTVDLIARNWAAALTKEIGQNVIVENKPGANGSIGALDVKRAEPDGCTLLLGTLGQMAINPTLYKKLPYDTLKDFAPVSQVSLGPLLLVANPAFAPNSIQELIAYARARPGKVDFASGGNGITAHLAMEIFQSQAGIELHHVPYKGSPAALNDVMSGVVPIMFDAVPSALPQVKAGKLKSLGVSSRARNAQLPSTATVIEQGLPNFDVNSWVGFLAPVATPADLVAGLNAAIRRAATHADLKRTQQEFGSDVIATTPDQFASFLQTEVRKWGKAVVDGNVQID